ncbi:hypothetical protein BKA64DRAFT_635451 [Cadophora sp. MPI-SDFR-AT-0126]|nr:hypothetical protein BKA64DRAFT_635451 [Leotiomycetes sp. MPI-SDFR-AT-0126]
MSSSEGPKKPTAVEFLRLISGARVDVYVGKDKKHYVIPKDLLCYYSTYFDRCFNGEFKEAKEGKLELPEDDVQDFEILLEYMLRGVLPLDSIEARGEAAISNDMYRRYMGIIEYADKYSMQHGIGELLCHSIKSTLLYNNRIAPGDVELIFRIFGKGASIREVITQAALSKQGPDGVVFRKQEEDIPEFAQQMLGEVRKASRIYSGQNMWIDPITSAYSSSLISSNITPGVIILLPLPDLSTTAVNAWTAHRLLSLNPAGLSNSPVEPRSTTIVRNGISTNSQETSAIEFLKLISGTKVDIYVGKEKKHYNLPKPLLCHYSPYFARCFNSAFKDAEEQKLELLEDKIEDFEILLEFMLHGSTPDALDLRGAKEGLFTTCMAVILYADKFAMGELICEHLRDRMKAGLKRLAGGPFKPTRVTPDHIELVCRLTRDGSPVRTLLAQEVLSYSGVSYCLDQAFHALKKANPGFAYEMLRQLRMSIRNISWIDPISGRVRKEAMIEARRSM